MCEEEKRLRDLYAATLEEQSDVMGSILESEWTKAPVIETMEKLDFVTDENRAAMENWRQHIKTHGCLTS